VNAFEVNGGKRLSGSITAQGAKNEALQVISAVLLTSEKVTISNIPDILDVNLLIELIGRNECQDRAPGPSHLQLPGGPGQCGIPAK
jgi:UDP-N-acetylglucosamine 1-carboxyvinyltransferase